MTAAPKKTIVTAIAVLLFLQAGFLQAQESKPQPPPPRAGAVTHILGDQSFIFGLGALFPLFFVKMSDGTVEATNLSIGPKASIEYMNYLSQSFALGIEVTGGFAFSPNFNIYWALPITAKIIYIIYIGSTQLFLDLGAGIILEKFLEYGHLDFFAKPQVSFYIPIDPTLDLGLAVGYWFVPQFATPDQPQDQSRLGNFLDISVSLIYHL
ncbi:MAG: hypothetical protein JXD23_15435 [Spirochaetales bacterium]|nr:hypothetical protein [Spirochaetales bacterium]